MLYSKTTEKLNKTKDHGTIGKKLYDGAIYW